METTYSYFVTLFVARFQAYLVQRDSKLIEILNKKQIIIQNHITIDNFIKMVKRFCPQLNSIHIKQMYKEFNTQQSQKLKISSFINSFEVISKKLPKSMQTKKVILNQQKKQTAVNGLKKLQMFIEQSNVEQLFNQCDVSQSGQLNVQQFNKLLLISQIPQLKQHTIRKLILQMIYSKYGQGITKDNFFTLFGIDPIKHRQKIKENNQIPAIKIKPDNPLVLPNKLPIMHNKNISQPEIQNDKQKLQKNMKKNHQGNYTIFQAKNISQENQPVRVSHDQLHTNLYKIIPRAMYYFRNGQPQLQDMRFMEQLQQYLKANKIFVDIHNPATHIGRYATAQQIFGSTKYSLFEMAPSVIHRQKSRVGIARQIQPKDIMQGRIGDCYFLSAIASLVSLYPQMIAQRFLVNCNSSHMMGVKLFIDGEWIIYQTDDRFPVEYNKPVFAKPHGKEIWVMLLEKCWAKAHKKYKSIQSGTPRQGFLSLTGAPSQYINLQDKQNRNNLKQILQNSTRNRYVTTVSGNEYLSSLSKQQQKTLGLVPDHSYSFLKLIKIGNETIFKLRNPWGNQIWKGKWSYNSSDWTPELRKIYNYTQPTDDGSFFIDWNNFSKYFSNIVICKANPIFLHSNVRTSFNSRKSNYFQFTIQEQSIFNFTIYQASKRINQKYSNYQFSPARIIILKRIGQRLQYIGSMNKIAYDCNVEVNLTPGVYVLAAKIKWITNDFGNQAVITSYGNERISMQPIDRSISAQFKKDMILTFMKKYPGQVKKYENIKIPQAFNEKYLDIKKGIGYMRYCNKSKNKSFQTTVSMNLQGIKVIKPSKIPQTFIMKSGSQYVVGFFINAEGYTFQSSQSIKYLN